MARDTRDRKEEARTGRQGSTGEGAGSEGEDQASGRGQQRRERTRRETRKEEQNDRAQPRPQAKGKNKYMLMDKGHLVATIGCIYSTGHGSYTQMPSGLSLMR